MTAERLLARLDAVRRVGDGRWIARCPAHDDKGPSLSIRELPDLRVLLHCFSGCSANDVLGAIGLKFGDLFERPLGHIARGERPPFVARDALQALAYEATVAQIAAEDLARGKGLSPEDRDRLALAASRIREGAALAGGARQ